MRELGTGEMSRVSGLSLKALRLYEANGLLVPASIDARTGYRRYGQAELARARSIESLRRIGMPLARVRELLDAPPDALRRELTAWWDAERSAFARRSQVVDVVTDDAANAHLDRRAVDALTERVQVVDRPARRIASITRVVEQAELVPTTLADVIDLRRHLAAQGASPLDAHQFIFHDPVGFGLPGRVEAAVPYEGRADPVGEMVLRVEPAVRLAGIEVTADELAYPALLRFYDVVRRAAERFDGSAGAPRELYERPWSTAAGALVAMIAIPVRLGLDPAPGADPTLEA
ncbi:MerR family transcriptional regulator [Agromyces salentinus]|uniref:Helix-turn-helix domain-containing protein n=1 Tax=Agromyces salentinus TaxID=269421 RepID=A0ABP4Z290_9MICO|nr:MerR family transcriptional regulator [Agromyces salentinus]